MPFFESADHYRMNGGNFSYSQGDTTDYHYDNSIRVEGQGNSVTNASQSFRTDNSIINNCGQMTVFGQGGNANIHVNSFGFQENNGMFPMFPYSQMQMHVDHGTPSYSPGHTMSQYSSQEPQPRRFDPMPQGPGHFDPGMGQPQQFGSDRTPYQSSAPYVNQYPMADVPPAAAYPTGHTNLGTQNVPSWSEPSGMVRSRAAVERPSDSGSFYTRSAPPQPPPMMPVPSPARASTPSQIPSQVPTPVPLTMPTPAASPAPASAPIPSESINSTSTPISPVTLVSTPSWSHPQERATSPHIGSLSVPGAQPEVHRSPSALSQNAAPLNFTAPYAYRAVDQTHAHETPRTTQQAQDDVSMPHSAVSSSPVEVWRSERGSSPSPSQRSPPPQRPLSLGAPQIIQTSRSDTTLSQSSRITSSSSGPASVAGQSRKTREDRVSPRPSEKAITGVHERELSLDSVPPPAYTLEPETPFETGGITQEPTSTMDLRPSMGVDNQEYQYSNLTAEVVRQEEDSLPDIILPKKKKRKQGWRFSEMFTRRSRNNNDPAVEL